MEFFEKLTCPKHMDMNQGTHASAELLGFIGLDMGNTAAAHIWGQARSWLDFYLKGVDNDTPNLPQVQMQLGNDGILSDYVSFSSWPPQSGWSVQNYTLGPRQGAFGALSRDGRNLASNDTITFSSKGAKMSTGTILVSDLIKDIVPITANLAAVDPAHAIVYTTGAIQGSSRICGVPRLSNLRVVPTESQFQIVAFLYDMDLNSMKGRLISHGASTVWKDAGVTAGNTYEFDRIDFHTACWDFTSGHALALGISLYDGLYKPASETVSLTLDYGAPTTLELPLTGDALPNPNTPITV